MKNKRLSAIILAVAILLLIPLIAMQFTDEVSWGIFDFVVAGTLLLGTGLLIDFVIRKIPKVQHRIAISLVILALLVLVWMELAVGILGTSFGGT